MSRNRIFFLLFLILPVLGFAGNGFIYLADTTKLFWASNNEIYTPDKKQLLYFKKGNIFFSGDADSKENIFLIATSTNLGSANLELIYEKGNEAPSYSFSTFRFYIGKNETEDFRQKNEVIHVERKKKWLAFYATGTDSLLAYYAADSLPASTAIVVACTLIKKYELEKRLNIVRNQLPFQESSYSAIRPNWGNSTANEWMWDGKVFRPKWNVDPRYAWTFDGQTVKPLSGTNIYSEYSWDGENFKPLWRSNKNEEWSWDGRIMKPVWDTDWANQYIIENGLVKPWSNVHPEKEWKMDGNIPIPLIILVISGIARAN